MDLWHLFRNAETVEERAAGELVLEEGKPGDVMYVVLEGQVEIMIHGRSIAKVARGGIVGEMALVDSKARSASAVALSDCKLAVVDEKQFLAMVQQTPSFALHVMRVLANRLRRMDAAL